MAYSSPRQRIEFLSWPPAPAGSTFRYTWSTYLQSPISTGKQFFHLWQLFSREEGGPTVSLTATNGRVAIDDNVREGCAGSCPSIALGGYTDKVVKHDLKVTYGKEGSLLYTMTDAGTGQTLLRYTGKGDMGQDSSLKVSRQRQTASFRSLSRISSVRTLSSYIQRDVCSTGLCRRILS
jgi:hypothetical protein